MQDKKAGENREISRRHLVGAATLMGAGVLSLGKGGLIAPAFAKAPHIAKKVSPKVPVVMIDPGHGGKDPGAIGVSGIYEKQVVHAVAAELCLALNRSGRCKADVTRHKDDFISLNDRVGIAQEKKSALMVSLHADSFHSVKVRGASVYTLGRAPAHDQLARSLERSENAADRYGHSKMRGVDSDVFNILSSMVVERTHRSSAHMAGMVVKSFQGKTALLTSPVRHAGFVVLKSRTVPSVLVEMGFLSNYHDEQALRSRLHRRLLAAQLANAIEHYLLWQKAEGYFV